MNKGKKLYEGKAKILYEGPEKGTAIQHFKDHATAFNNLKKSNYNQKINTITLSAELILFLQSLQKQIPKKNLLKCKPNNTAIHIGISEGGTAHNVIPKKSLFRWETRHINEDLKYKIYTNKFDKTIKAEEYCKKNELFQLHNQLLKESKDTFLTVKRLAKKLQNKLIIK